MFFWFQETFFSFDLYPWFKCDFKTFFWNDLWKVAELSLTNFYTTHQCSLETALFQRIKQSSLASNSLYFNEITLWLEDTVDYCNMEITVEPDNEGMHERIYQVWSLNTARIPICILSFWNKDKEIYLFNLLEELFPNWVHFWKQWNWPKERHLHWGQSKYCERYRKLKTIGID